MPKNLSQKTNLCLFHASKRDPDPLSSISKTTQSWPKNHCSFQICAYLESAVHEVSKIENISFTIAKQLSTDSISSHWFFALLPKLLIQMSTNNWYSSPRGEGQMEERLHHPTSISQKNFRKKKTTSIIKKNFHKQKNTSKRKKINKQKKFHKQTNFHKQKNFQGGGEISVKVIH